MSLTWRSRLALLVSLGPTPTTGVPDLATSAGAADGATEAALRPTLSLAGAPPLMVPSVLVVVEPLPQPASKRADRAPTTIIFRRGRDGWPRRTCRAGSR